MIRPTFALRRFGKGYRCEEVDAFVDRVMSAIDGTEAGAPLTAGDLQSARFGVALVGQGYAIDEVDRFLEQAEAWLPIGLAATQPGGQRDGYPRPEFTPVRVREGYDMAEVDAFVDRVFATLEGRTGTPVLPQEVRDAQFTPVRVREGYDVVEVDAWLDQAERWLGEH